jgi:hypothetical protein
MAFITRSFPVWIPSADGGFSDQGVAPWSLTAVPG